MFEGRRLVIATKHRKEEILAPLLEKELGVICFVDPHFDSDLFGTFSGEIERKENPWVTAKLKVERAMEMTNCDLGIASEGSFGNHPIIHFLPADEELLMLYDKKNKATFVWRELSVETNFKGAYISSLADLEDFATKVKFPSHALILRKSKDCKEEIIKGILDWNFLVDAFNNLRKCNESVFIETDMRAMFNPTRRKVISTAVEKLMNIIKSTCPVCQFPGFSVVESKKGLPCNECHSPTQSTLSLIYKCKKCGAIEEEFFPNGKKEEDPTFCLWCNP
jgi:hypothetical protein